MTVKSLMRSVRNGSRRAADRLFHGFRRRAARAAAGRNPAPTSILVVCHGNICRSPFAEAAIRRALKGAPVIVESAGFIGPGRKPPENAIQAASGRGIQMEDHRSQTLGPDLVRAADLVVTMDVHQAREIRERFGKARDRVVLLGDFDPRGSGERTITDPVDGPLELFELVYARIERCADVLGGEVLTAMQTQAVVAEAAQRT
jgi:low molecular weight protein-tyrosine phosphatase